MTGILLIDKPADWTSHDVVAKLRGLLRERRIGHSGTLDPMATGLLAVFVGRATRAVEFAEADEKEYLAKIRLGLVTDTQDISGTVLTETDTVPDAAALSAALARFRGGLDQLPPMYSAIKRDGKKLYELARRGVEVERAPRRIYIRELELLEQLGRAEYSLRVRCSKGTYIRTLCHDIGAFLGCGACMSGLRRTRAGVFSLTEAYSLDDVAAAPDPSALLLPVDALFSSFPSLLLKPPAEKPVRNGCDVPMPGLPDGEVRVYDAQGRFLMLGRGENGVLKTVKSFFELG